MRGHPPGQRVHRDDVPTRPWRVDREAPAARHAVRPEGDPRSGGRDAQPRREDPARLSDPVFRAGAPEPQRAPITEPPPADADTGELPLGELPGPRLRHRQRPVAIDPAFEEVDLNRGLSEQELNALADSLHARAAAGEDVVKLQKEAFEAGGQKVDSPTVNLPKVRRTGLPPAHAEVFDLKVGEVSKVISDNGGHYIYKVVSKEVLPLEQVKDEIHNKLKSERLKEMMDKYTNSFTAIPNEEYFGPAAAAGPQPPNMRGRMPTPRGQPQGAPQQPAPPQAAPPPAANPPAPTAPPTKPN